MKPTPERPSPPFQNATAGNPAPSFEDCYRSHRAWIFRLCLHFGNGNVSWAEDVTQEVLIKMFQHLPRLANPDDIGAWLYRVAARQALSRLRREHSFLGRILKLLQDKPEPVVPSPEILFAEQEAAAAVLATLRSLPDRERIVLTMKILDGKSQQEIADALGFSKGYVSKLVARAWKRIESAGWEVHDEA